MKRVRDSESSCLVLQGVCKRGCLSSESSKIVIPAIQVPPCRPSWDQINGEGTERDYSNIDSYTRGVVFPQHMLRHGNLIVALFLPFSLKCYISPGDDNSGILVDAMQILDALTASYPLPLPQKPHPLLTPPPLNNNLHPPPALQLLHESCHEHTGSVGCGATTLICLAGYWAAEILCLVDQVRGQTCMYLISYKPNL